MNSARFERPRMSPRTERWIENRDFRVRMGVRLSRSRHERQPRFERAAIDGSVVEVKRRG